MDMLTNPFFWALWSMCGILASTAIAARAETADQPRLRALAGLLFGMGSVGLAAPWTAQSRFGGASLWNEIVGGVVIALALWLIVPGLRALTQRSRFAGLWTRDLYDIMRNPVYLGEILFAAGAATAMGSYIGLSLTPLWVLCFTVPVAMREFRLQRTLGHTYLRYLQRVPSRFLPRWLLRRRPASRYPYRNLAFKGGGVRGIAYVGALEILDKEGILDQIERVAGTSVGAMTALLVSLRLDLKSVIETMNSLDYEQVPQARTLPTSGSRLWHRLPLVPSETACWERLLTEYGWFSSEYVYSWLQDVIAEHCNGKGRATFADFRALGMRDLYVVAANISQRRSEVFSFENTPDVAVADAVRLSMSIPIYFQSLRFNGQVWGEGDYYVDGGVYDNYPIQVFDAPRFAAGNGWYEDGINWETLGCYLYPEAVDVPQEPQNLREYLKLTMVNVLASNEALAYERNPFDRLRTIKVGDRGVGAIEFDLEPHGPRYQALIDSGREAARAFIEAQRL